MPETTEPQLSEGDVAELQARSLRSDHHDAAGFIPLAQFELDALIRDWQAMRAERLKIQRLLASTALEDPTEDDDPPYSTTELVEGVRFLLRMKNSARQRTAALREQLAAVTTERDQLRQIAKEEGR